MTSDETLAMLSILAAAYPNFYKKMSPEETEGVTLVWSVQFADVPADIVYMALQKAIGSCKFPPSIKEVKDKIRELHWEAYDVVSAYGIEKALNPTALEDYRRIYEATKSFKHSTGNEPAIDRLLSNANNYLSIEG